jgi:hypothetical protein
MRYFFNRDGAIVCSRDTLAECMYYARRNMGWDQHQGKDRFTNQFVDRPVIYKVEEHELLPSNHPDYWRSSYRRTYNDLTLDPSQAIKPF